MSEISRAALFGKLNPMLYKAMEGATVFAKLRGNPYVEFVHWMHQIMQLQDSDLHRIVRHFDCDAGTLASDVTRALDRLPRGATAISDISPHIDDSIERAWVYGSLLFGDQQVRGGHLLVGMLKTSTLRNLLFQVSGQFQRIRLDLLTEEFRAVLEGSPEQGQTASSAMSGATLGAMPGEASDAMPPAAMGKEEALRRFTQDLTERAAKGELDPVTGRDEEIRQLVDILMRRRQNNPILTGEAGVGKTAVVEGFALRISRGDVPPALKDVRVLSLDVGLLQAGASMKGEFEARLRQVIDEVQASPSPIVLFIDEAHTLIGAGGAAGTGDAANLLKPALARGTLRTIAATTWAEYKKYIEKDPALTRRFQVIQVQEPDEEKAIRMMRGIVSPLENHHRVQVRDEAIRAAVQLSHRYIPARQLPDKAVSLLDTACARVAVSQHATPAEVEDEARRIESLDMELGIVEREEAVGEDVSERKEGLLRSLALARDRHATLEVRWQEEKQLVDRILALRSMLRNIDDSMPHDDSEAVDQEPSLDPGSGRRMQLSQLRDLQASLARLQGSKPLILSAVDEQAVATVVADWTGIPVGQMVKDEIHAVLGLAQTLNTRVLGQRHGLDMIARRIQTARARLDNPGKPVGVFMLVGPSGVGKTETALALAEALYGGEQNVVTINMSEFQEAHTVSTLKGAPPGYVGYGEGGVLTEAVRRRPYSVVLLDEVEKAHPDVHELFFQVFDKGRMEDGEGRMIDFRNTIILLTSNVGSDLIMNMCKDPELMPDPEALAVTLREPLLKVFPAALLGRIVTIPYFPLSDAMLGDIVRLQLERIVKRVKDNHGIALHYDDDVVRLVSSRCTELESGGRMIDAVLTNTVLPRLSHELLESLAEGRRITAIGLGVRDADFSYEFTSA
jgi:type VI secretion system protein VasG